MGLLNSFLKKFNEGIGFAKKSLEEKKKEYEQKKSPSKLIGELLPGKKEEILSKEVTPVGKAKVKKGVLGTIGSIAPGGILSTLDPETKYAAKVLNKILSGQEVSEGDKELVQEKLIGSSMAAALSLEGGVGKGKLPIKGKIIEGKVSPKAITKGKLPSLPKLPKGVVAKAEAQFAKPEVAPVVKPTKELDPLTQEAKKYKSAEEFVDSKEPLFHNTRIENVESIKETGLKLRAEKEYGGFKTEEGIWVYPSKKSADLFGKRILEAPSKTINVFIEGKLYQQPSTKIMIKEYGGDNIRYLASDKVLIDRLKSKGFIGIKGRETGQKQIFIFDESAVKTKSQLTDIYNKAKAEPADLTQEAKKYNSAEDFINIEKHKRDTSISAEIKNSIRFAELEKLKFGDEVMDGSEFAQKLLDDKWSIETYKRGNSIGYKATKIVNGNKQSINVSGNVAKTFKFYEESNLPTKSQLTDIYNKAKAEPVKEAFEPFSPNTNRSVEIERNALQNARIGTGEFKVGEVYQQEVASGLRPIQITKVNKDGSVEGWYIGSASKAERVFKITPASLSPAKWNNPKQELFIPKFNQARLEEFIDKVFGVKPKEKLAAKAEPTKAKPKVKKTKGKFPTIHKGGVVKMVEGSPIKIVDGVETFLHKDENGNWVVSEATTGRDLSGGGFANSTFAIKAAKSNIENVGIEKFKKLISENQLPKAKAEPVKEEQNKFLKKIVPKKKVKKVEPKKVESKVVERTTESPKIPATVYENNRNVKRGTIAVVVKDFKDIKDGIKLGLDRYLGVVSTRLKNINPELKNGLRKFEFKLRQGILRDTKEVKGMLDSTKKFSRDDYIDFDLARKNGDEVKIKELVKKYGIQKEYQQTRDILDELYKRADEVGYDIGYLKDYHPRIIKDQKGFIDHFKSSKDWGAITQAISAKENTMQRYLTEPEKAQMINTLIRGYQLNKISLSETGNMKSRVIDLVDSNINKFYMDSNAALVRYIEQANEAIEARKFFGKTKLGDGTNINDNIGSYVLRLMQEGKINPEQEALVAELLRARFNQVGTRGVVSLYKNLSYVDTMGSPTSAITQIGDLAWALYKSGIPRTVKSFYKSVRGKSIISKEDIGIDNIATEFSDSSKSSKAVSRVFKLTGLEKMDALGKETLINSSITKYQSWARSGDKRLQPVLKAIFGNKTDDVITALKNGNITEDVKLIAFNELADMQPILLSEMPEKYLTGGNGRIFYMLKTFTLKQFDIYRNEIFQKIATPGTRLEGLKNMVALLSFFVIMNATADEVKDFLLNRKTSLKDRTVDNILRAVGFSKYLTWKARTEGVGSALVRQILPPFKFIDSVSKDIINGVENGSEVLQSIPLGGKLYYWWFGKGKYKNEKRNKVSPASIGLPKLPKLKLPQLPKIPTS